MHIGLTFIDVLSLFVIVMRTSTDMAYGITKIQKEKQCLGDELNIYRQKVLDYKSD